MSPPDATSKDELLNSIQSCGTSKASGLVVHKALGRNRLEVSSR